MAGPHFYAVRHVANGVEAGLYGSDYVLLKRIKHRNAAAGYANAGVVIFYAEVGNKATLRLRIICDFVGHVANGQRRYFY